MEKVARGVPKRFFIDEAEALGKDLDKLRLLYSEAKTANASEEVLGRIKELAALAGA
jgi:hypothetical protein